METKRDSPLKNLVLTDGWFTRLFISSGLPPPKLPTFNPAHYFEIDLDNWPGPDEIETQYLERMEKKIKEK